jgi:predicted nuclease of predicted toxin-antitoxin system
VKFKIDENLPIEFVGLLIIAGHQAMTVTEQHLQGRADPVIIDTCAKEGYILVTLDLDFADIRTYPPTQYPGLMVFRVVRQDKRHLIEVFQRAINVLMQEPIEGRLWIIEETKVRIRGGE